MMLKGVKCFEKGKNYANFAVSIICALAVCCRLERRQTVS